MLTGEKARQEDGGGAKAPGRIFIINIPASLSIIVTSFERIKFDNFYFEPVMPELGLYLQAYMLFFIVGSLFWSKVLISLMKMKL